MKRNVMHPNPDVKKHHLRHHYVRTLFTIALLALILFAFCYIFFVLLD